MSDAFKAAQSVAAAIAAPGIFGRSQSFVPPPPPQPATRQGQREIVAATLAAGMIAASGGAVTAEGAVSLWREVMGEAWPG